MGAAGVASAADAASRSQGSSAAAAACVRVGVRRGRHAAPSAYLEQYRTFQQREHALKDFSCSSASRLQKLQMPLVSSRCLSE